MARNIRRFKKKRLVLFQYQGVHMRNKYTCIKIHVHFIMNAQQQEGTSSRIFQSGIPLSQFGSRWNQRKTGTKWQQRRINKTNEGRFIVRKMLII